MSESITNDCISNNISEIDRLQNIAINKINMKLCIGNRNHIITNILNKRKEFEEKKINENKFINYLVEIINIY